MFNILNPLGGGVSFNEQIRFALESANKELEREYTWYIRVDNTQFLEAADDRETQTQAHLGNHSGLKIRLRRVDKDHTLTTKRELKDETGSTSDVEITQNIDEDLYNELITSALVEHVYNKTRFIFNIPGTNLKWEVDVFQTDSGAISEWFKVDLELPEGASIAELPKFPIEPVETVAGKSDAPGTQAHIERLWTREWPITTDPSAIPTIAREHNPKGDGHDA